MQNYQITTVVPLNTTDISAKLNHTLNDKNRFSLSFALQSRNGRQAQLYGFQDHLDGLGWQSEVGWTHNFGPRTINSFHWAFSRNRSNYVPYFAFGPNVAAAIGIQGTSQNPLNYGPPNLSFTNFGNMVDGNPVVRRDQSSALRDAVTVVRGLHSLTFGGEYRRIQSNPITDTNGRGAFVFSGLLTSGFDDNLQAAARHRLRPRGLPLRFSEHRQGPLWKLRQLLPLDGLQRLRGGRLEDPLQPVSQPGPALRVFLAVHREVRPHVQPGSGQRRHRRGRSHPGAKRALHRRRSRAR